MNKKISELTTLELGIKILDIANSINKYIPRKYIGVSTGSGHQSYFDFNNLEGIMELTIDFGISSIAEELGTGFAKYLWTSFDPKKNHQSESINYCRSRAECWVLLND